jgi:hypothetical protein
VTVRFSRRAQAHGVNLISSLLNGIKNNEKVLPKIFKVKFMICMCYFDLLSSRQLSKNVQIRIYETIILPAVLYGCENWSLTLRGERKLRVFEKNVLRRIFGPKRDEITGGWGKLHNEKLHDLYPSVSVIRTIKSRRMRWAGHVKRIGRRGMHMECWR